MTADRRLNKDILVIGIAIAALLIPVVLVEYNVLQFTGGVFSYPQDDTFIHMAIAKNLAYHGIWGINSHEFSSASSSILYPIILMVAFKLFGLHLIIPLIINTLAAIILLIVIQRWLKKQTLRPIFQLLILLTFIFLTPLPILVICGMEHTLQVLFCFLFIYEFAAIPMDETSEESKKQKLPWQALLYGFLLTSIRYEGIYIVGIACLIMLAYKKIFLSIYIGLAALIPILTFGIYSIAHGYYFVPNSVLLKSRAPSLDVNGLFNFFTNDIFIKLTCTPTYNLIAAQRLLFVLLIVWLLFIGPIRRVPAYRQILSVLLICDLLYVSVTGYTWIPRYEAWLIGCSIVIIGTVVALYGKEVLKGRSLGIRLLATFIGMILLFPLFFRSRDAFQNMSQAAINVYEQQYQMGRFLHTYYYDDHVAIGDIGAVSYFTAGKNLDLVGLGNMDIARSRRDLYYTPDFIDWLSRRDSAKIAVIYEAYNNPDLLKRWHKTATWQMPNNVACGDDIVSFFSIDSTARPELIRNLKNFQRFLPKDVQVSYY